MPSRSRRLHAPRREDETTAGGVAGYTQDTKIQQGSAGTSILQNMVQYFLHTANGVSVSPIATNTVYRGTDGTGAEITSDSYTWFTGTTQIQSLAVSRRDAVHVPDFRIPSSGAGVRDVQLLVVGRKAQAIGLRCSLLSACWPRR